MATKTLRTPIPPTFSKSPKKDVSAKLTGERTMMPAKTPDEIRTNQVGKSSDTLRIIEWDNASWIWVIVVPIAVWCLLLILMPTFVKRHQNESKLDHQSMLLWTLIISLVIWILFFGFAKCKSC